MLVKNVSIAYTKTPIHYTIVSSYNMDSIPSEYKALGLVVFSKIIYLFIIYLFIHLLLMM